MLHAQVHESTQSVVFFLLPPDQSHQKQNSDQLILGLHYYFPASGKPKQNRTEESAEVLGVDYLYMNRNKEQYDTKAPNSPTPLQHHHNSRAEQRLQWLTSISEN